MLHIKPKEKSSSQNISSRSEGTQPSGTALTDDIPQQAQERIPDPAQILSAVAQAPFTWNLESDELIWSETASEILNMEDTAVISSGSAYGRFIDPDIAQARQKAITEAKIPDPEAGLSYSTKYRFKCSFTQSTRSLWIEEIGRVYGDENGKAKNVTGVIRVVNDRFDQSKQIVISTRQDDLTGQLSHSQLTEKIGETLSARSADRKPAAFLMVGVDQLSRINNMYGYTTGDEVLVAVGRRLRTVMRENDIIGRYASNKYGIILTECLSEELEVVAKRLSNAIEGGLISTSSVVVPVSLSIGAVKFPLQAKNVSETISYGLEALETAKSKKQDCFAIFETSAKNKLTREHNAEVTDEVVAAMQSGRLRLALQPVVKTDTGDFSFDECLLRMVRENGDIAPAGEFMEIVEQSGLSRILDQHVLDLAIKHLITNPDRAIAINVSSLTTLEDNWVTKLEKLTKKAPELRQKIVVELTEMSAINQPEQTQQFVRKLKALGCKVAIDDFGAGFTSYKNLRTLGADILKIDGSFVRDALNSQQDRVFLKMISELAKLEGIETVAEWVEDEATANFLKSTGITYMQGYLLGRPVLAETDSDN